jgi:hypothetical protein
MSETYAHHKWCKTACNTNQCSTKIVNKCLKLKTVFWYVTPWSLAETDHRFGGTYCLNFQDRRDFSLLLWRWRQQVPVKCWYLAIRLCGVTFQKIFTTVRTPHFTKHTAPLHPKTFRRNYHFIGLINHAVFPIALNVHLRTILCPTELGNHRPKTAITTAQNRTWDSTFKYVLLEFLFQQLTQKTLTLG